MKRPAFRVLALALRNLAQEPRRIAPGLIQMGMVLACVLVGISMQGQLSRNTAPGMQLIQVYFAVNVIALHLMAMARMAPARALSVEVEADVANSRAAVSKGLRPAHEGISDPCSGILLVAGWARRISVPSLTSLQR
jgi:hypothetical protein